MTHSRGPSLKERLLDPRLFLIVALAGFLIFANLGDLLLWQDEAETAILARSVLANGKPIAFDGRNLVFQTSGTFDEDYVWEFHPWGQFYVTALSFALFGASTFSARLPFAVAGLLALPLSYAFYRRRLRFSPNAAFLAVLILTLSVPLLLHIRQCRYYSLGLLFMIVLVDGFLGMLEVDHKKSAGRLAPCLEYILGGVCLFYSNFGALFAFLPAVGSYVALARRDLLRKPSFVVATLLMIVPIVYGFFYFDLAVQMTSEKDSDTGTILISLAIFVKFLDEFYFPVLLLLLLPIIFLLAPIRRTVAERGHLGCLREMYADLPYKGFLLTLTAFNVAFFSLAGDWGYVRYLVHMVPFVVPFVAAPLVWLARAAGLRAAGAALVVFLLLVNLNPPVVSLAFGALPLEGLEKRYEGGVIGETAAYLRKAQAVVTGGYYTPRLHGPALLEYLYEITHGYSGYLGPILEFLHARAREGDTVLIGFEDLPFIFYTDLEVRGGLQRVGLRGALGASETFGLEMEEPPEFIIWKGFTRSEIEALQRMLYRMEAAYEEMTIDVPHLPVENRPDPWYHKFRSVPPNLRLSVWVLKRG